MLLTLMGTAHMLDEELQACIKVLPRLKLLCSHVCVPSSSHARRSCMHGSRPTKRSAWTPALQSAHPFETRAVSSPQAHAHGARCRGRAPDSKRA